MIIEDTHVIDLSYILPGSSDSPGTHVTFSFAFGGDLDTNHSIPRQVVDMFFADEIAATVSFGPAVSAAPDTPGLSLEFTSYDVPFQEALSPGFNRVSGSGYGGTASAVFDKDNKLVGLGFGLDVGFPSANSEATTNSYGVALNFQDRELTVFEGEEATVYARVSGSDSQSEGSIDTTWSSTAQGIYYPNRLNFENNFQNSLQFEQTGAVSSPGLGMYTLFGWNRNDPLIVHYDDPSIWPTGSHNSDYVIWPTPLVDTRCRPAILY